MNLQMIKAAARLSAGNAKLALKAKSPQIMIATGIIAGITATVFACKATLHIEEVIDTAQKHLEVCKEGLIEHTDAVYNEGHYQRDLVIIYAQTGVKVLRLYAPAIILGGLSIFSIVNGYGILNRRNLAITAAYTALESTFKEYRQRVTDRYGEETENSILNNTHIEKISVVGEDGKKHKESIEVAGSGNMYSWRFDHKNVNWNHTSEYNESYLRNMEQYANDLLRARGHIFLNEILDMLGITRVDYGQLVGWRFTDGEDAGDNYVDFGVTRVMEPISEGSDVMEEVYMMNFNVDGETWDMI